MKTPCLLAVGIALLMAAPATAGIADRPEPQRLYTDRTVTGVATSAARTLVTGEFAWAGRHVPSAVIVSPLSGAPQAFIDTDFEFLTHAIPDADDGWYIVGERRQVRHVRADGTVDPGFAVTTDDEILSITLSGDGSTLWLAGWFERVGGQARAKMAAVRASDGAVLPWTSSVTAWEPDVVRVSPGGDIVYVAGGTWAQQRWNSVVALDAVSGAVRGYGQEGWSDGLVVGPDAVYAGIFGEGVRPGVAALDPATLSTRWRVETGGAPSGMGLARGRLFLTGVEIVAGQARGGSAALDAASGTLTEWTAGIPLRGLLLAPDGETLYSTYVPYDPDQASIQVAISTRDGAELAWAADSRGGPWTISRDGARIFMGAYGINTRIRFGAALLDETAHVVTWAAPSSDLGNHDVVGTQLAASGGAYAVRHDEHNRRASVIGLSPDGVRAWQLVADGWAAITLAPDEQTLYVTGSFTRLGGQARPGFAAVRAADGALLPWAPVPAGGSIAGAVPTSDGRTLYVHGSFTSIDSVARRGVAALDVATGAVLPFDPNLEGSASLAKLSPDERVLYLSGASLVGVATTDGRPVWQPAVNAVVRAFEPLADGRTVVVAADIDDRPLTAWDAQTGAQLNWNPLDLPCFGSCTVEQLELDGRYLHVLGDFKANGAYESYARIPVGPAPAPSANAVAPRVVGPTAFNRYAECDPGHWTGRPDAYRFAWRVDGVLEAGFDGREFLLIQSDLGRTVSCEVSAGGAFVPSAPIMVTTGEVFTPAPRRRTIPPDAPTPTPTATPTPAKTDFGGSPPPEPTPTPVATPAPTQRDRVAPRVTVRRRTLPFRFSLSEPATVSSTLRGSRRTFKLSAGTHTFTARRLTGRSKLPRGRHTLTLRLRDAAGNARVVRFRV